ncbi:MAG: hypothetical protein K0Q46_3661 [Rhodococcus erythropolis]|nr:hypothetical protein [Rhodococcus erythropolis]
MAKNDIRESRKRCLRRTAPEERLGRASLWSGRWLIVSPLELSVGVVVLRGDRIEIVLVRHLEIKGAGGFHAFIQRRSLGHAACRVSDVSQRHFRSHLLLYCHCPRGIGIELNVDIEHMGDSVGRRTPENAHLTECALTETVVLPHSSRRRYCNSRNRCTGLL